MNGRAGGGAGVLPHDLIRARIIGRTAEQSGAPGRLRFARGSRAAYAENLLDVSVTVDDPRAYRIDGLCLPLSNLEGDGERASRRAAG